MLNKIIPKFLIFSFVILATVQAVSTVFLSSAPEYAYAQDPLTLNVPIGEYEEVTFTGTLAPIGEYISVIYQYATGAVGIVAAVVLMWGGLVWITAAGNASRVGEAKAWIGASLTGLVLVLGAYMILSQINPDLVNFSTRKINPLAAYLGEEERKTCTWQMNKKERFNHYGSLLLKEDMALCGGKKDREQKGFNSFYNCYCSYIPFPGCSWSGDPCPNNTTTEIKEDENKIKMCGSSGLDKSYCCCHKIECDNCIEFAGIICKPGSNCSADADFVKSIEEVKKTLKEAGANDQIRVTEGWPPTQNHYNDCHNKGTCVDLNFYAGYSDDDIAIVANTFQNQDGLCAVWECRGGDCCDDLQGINCWADSSGDNDGNYHISADHFSIYKNKGLAPGTCRQ